MLAAALLAILSPGVEVRAQPVALRLDRQISAEVTFRAPAGPLTVRCSAGRIEQLTETAPGEWHAVWRAPKSLVPQVAIIVARRGDVAGFVALPLWGGGDAEVRTRPGAVVSVDIGAETFGPVKAGADGTALVPVVVPPGVDSAHQGGRLIDLHVPRTRTVEVGPIATEIPIDREREIEVVIAAVTRAGGPLQDAPLQLTASRGVVSAAEPLAPGLYRARWRIPPGAPGEVVFAATLPGDPAPSEVTVRLVPGEIASIELQTAQETTAGAPVELNSLAVDAAGNATDEPVQFSTSAGTLSSSATERGRYRVLLTPPPVLEDPLELTVIAATRRGSGGPVASARIVVTPMAAEEVEKSPPPRAAVAVRTGLLANGRGLTGAMFGLEAARRRQWRAMQVALVLDLWWARARQTTVAPSALIDARDDFFVGSLSGGLRLPLSESAAVWAQAGAAIVGASARVAVSGTTRGEATSRGLVPGIEIGFGAERRMWGGVPFLDLRILRTASFGLPNLVGALTGFTVCAGYRLEMP
jgi:hypothetical protein